MKRLPRWEGIKGVTAGSVNSWKHPTDRIFVACLRGHFTIMLSFSSDP